MDFELSAMLDMAWFVLINKEARVEMIKATNKLRTQYRNNPTARQSTDQTLRFMCKVHRERGL